MPAPAASGYRGSLLTLRHSCVADAAVATFCAEKTKSTGKARASAAAPSTTDGVIAVREAIATALLDEARVRTPLYRQAEELLWQLSKLGMVEELLGWLYIRIPAVHSFP